MSLSLRPSSPKPIAHSFVSIDPAAAAIMDDQASPLHPSRYIKACGYLKKERHGNVRTGWSDRYFVLSDSDLVWYKRNEGDELLGEERSSIPITKIVKLGEIREMKIPEFGRAGQWWGFAIETVDLTFNVAADRREVIEKWEAVISSELRTATRRSLLALGGNEEEEESKQQLMQVRADELQIWGMGYLCKERDGVMRTGWPERFVVIGHQHLYYFIREKEKSALDQLEKQMGLTNARSSTLWGEYRGDIPLLGSEVECSEVNTGKDSYVLLTILREPTSIIRKQMHRNNKKLHINKTRSRLVFRTDNLQLAQAWAAIIRAAIQNAQMRSKRPPMSPGPTKFGGNSSGNLTSSAGGEDNYLSDAEAGGRESSSRGFRVSDRSQISDISDTEDAEAGGTDAASLSLSLVKKLAESNGLEVHTLLSSPTLCSQVSSLLLDTSGLEAEAREAMEQEKQAEEAEVVKQQQEGEVEAASAAAAAAAAVEEDELGEGAVELMKPGPLTTLLHYPQVTDTTDSTQFRTRIGPNYKKHGRKAHSMAAPYSHKAFDIFKTAGRREHVASWAPLPAPPNPDEAPPACGLPRQLIVNIQIPNYQPRMTGGADDGPGWSAVCYFQASSSALQKWYDSGSPSSKLFTRWVDNCRQPVPDKKILGIFKISARVENLKQLGLGSFIESCNGKPVLITKGVSFTGQDYVEMTVNVHKFSYLCRKGLFGLFGRCKEMVISCAFLLEAREEDELPEQVVAALKVSNLDLDSMPQALPEQ